MSYVAAKALFRRDPATSWAAYVAGALLVLAHERGLSLASCGGLSILVSSDVPEGKGVSSSAAVEVAAMSALAAALGVELEGRALALLCQKVENHVVGELHYCCILCSAALHCIAAWLPRRPANCGTPCNCNPPANCASCPFHPASCFFSGTVTHRRPLWCDGSTGGGAGAGGAPAGAALPAGRGAGLRGHPAAPAVLGGGLG